MILIMLSNYVFQPTTFSPQDVINLEALIAISWNRGQVFNDVLNYIALNFTFLKCKYIAVQSTALQLQYNALQFTAQRCAVLFCTDQYNIMGPRAASGYD